MHAGPECDLRLPHGIQGMQAHTRIHMCIQKDNASRFQWHEVEGSKLQVSLEHLPFFTVGNKYMEL